MSQGVDPTRRALLRGRLRSPAKALPLPWAIPWSDFVAGCSRCGDCLAACPEGIIVQGDGGFPTLNFQHGECTFCGACVDACNEPLFLPREQTPWQLVARIGEGCLAFGQVFCQSCQDSCEPRAIRFSPAPRGIPVPTLIVADCTGCGACVAACPAQAIRVIDSKDASHEA